MKKYDVLLSGDNGIIFQDELGIADPEEVLNLLFNDKAQVDREEQISEVPDGELFRYYHSIKYSVKQIVE